MFPSSWRELLSRVTLLAYLPLHSQVVTDMRGELGRKKKTCTVLEHFLIYSSFSDPCKHCLFVFQVFLIYYLHNGNGGNIPFSLSTTPVPINLPTTLLSELSFWNTHLILLPPCCSSFPSTCHFLTLSSLPPAAFLTPNSHSDRLFCLGNVSCLIPSADSFSSFQDTPRYTSSVKILTRAASPQPAPAL